MQEPSFFCIKVWRESRRKQISSSILSHFAAENTGQFTLCWFNCVVWFFFFFNSWDISLPYFKPGRCLSLCTLLTRLHLCVPSILQQENITWIFSIIFVFVFFLWQSQGFDPLLLLPFLFAPTFKSLPATCCWQQPYEAKIYNAVVFFYQLVMMQNFNWKKWHLWFGKWSFIIL